MSFKNQNEEFESLKHYLEQINEIPLLSKEEEISFCRNIETGYRDLLTTIMGYTLERSQYEGLTLIQTLIPKLPGSFNFCSESEVTASRGGLDPSQTNKVKEYKTKEINSSYSQL